MDQQTKPVPGKSRSKGKKRKTAAVPSRSGPGQKHHGSLDGIPAGANPKKGSSATDLEAGHRSGSEEDELSSELSERSDAAPSPGKVKKSGKKTVESDKNKSLKPHMDPPKNEEEQKQEDVANEGYNAELQEELRIQQLKKQILADDQKNLRKLRKQYAKEQTYDGSQGQCCCTWKNEKGAKIIRYLDALQILQLNPRAVFAIWSLVDEDKVEIYARVRMVSFWLQWFFTFFSIIGFAFYTVFQNDEASNQFYLLMSLASLATVILFALLDYHFCAVINYYAAGAPKRRKRREKEERKKWRAEERERRAKQNFLPQIADGMAEDGIENPIVVPSQNLVLDINSDNAGVVEKEQSEPKSKAISSSKKHIQDNHGLDDSAEQRRQPSQKKKQKNKSRKSRKSRDVYDDEYQMHDEYKDEPMTLYEDHGATKDPVSLVGNEPYPLQEAAESRHGGSQRVGKKKKKKNRKTNNRLENYDDDFNGFD